MKKNHLIFPLLAVLSVGVLAACGAPSNEPSLPESDTGNSETESLPESEPAKDPVTIQLWTTLSYQTQIENMIESFKEVAPHVTVVNTKVSGSYDDLKTQVIQGFPTDNYPDLALAYPDHVADYLDYNKAANMESYMNDPKIGWTAESKDDVIENYLVEGQSYSVEGTYSLPFCKSTEAMYYNASVLVGLNLSTIDPTINGGDALTEAYLNNLTWEELFNKLCPAIIAYNKTLDAKSKILNEAEDGKWAVVGYDSDDNLFITLAEQYGFDYTSIDSATGKGQANWNTPEMKNLMKQFFFWKLCGIFCLYAERRLLLGEKTGAAPQRGDVCAAHAQNAQHLHF